MAYFRVAKSGYNAVTDPVEDMLIDSDYQTLLIADQGTGSFVPTSSATSFGISLSFIPFITLITQGGYSSQNLPSTAYGYELVLPQAFIAIGLNPPPTGGGQWSYWNDGSSNINYMYYIYYLPSQGSPSSASYPPANNPPYINITKNATENAMTTSLQNLSWTSQVQTLQILNKSTFNVSGTIAAASNHTFQFTNPLGYSTPLMAFLTSYTPSFTTVSNIDGNFEAIGRLNGDQVGIDSSYIYYNYNNQSSSSITVNFNLIVYLFIQPS